MTQVWKGPRCPKCQQAVEKTADGKPDQPRKKKNGKTDQIGKKMTNHHPLKLKM